PSLATCAVFISGCWCAHVTAPNTSGGSTTIGRAVTESMSLVRCALETYLSPHTVLRKRGAAHLCAPVRLRGGGGAAHAHPEDFHAHYRSESRRPITRAGSGECAYGLRSVRGRKAGRVAEHRNQAAPIVPQ